MKNDFFQKHNISFFKIRNRKEKRFWLSIKIKIWEYFFHLVKGIHFVKLIRQWFNYVKLQFDFYNAQGKGKNHGFYFSLCCPPQKSKFLGFIWSSVTPRPPVRATSVLFGLYHLHVVFLPSVKIKRCIWGWVYWFLNSF